MTDTRTTTLRQVAQAHLADELINAERYAHMRRYHKLHVYRDGTVGWSEYLNRTDDTIDERAKYFAPVPSVITVGTGTYGCNCDYCDMVYDPRDETQALDEGRDYDRDSKYECLEDAIRDAISNADLSGYDEAMRTSLGDIPLGYFDDEQEVQ